MRYNVERFFDTTPDNFLPRFGHLFKTPASDDMRRFERMLDDLRIRKSALVKRDRAHPLVSHATEDALGSICISTVENVVTPLLVSNAHDTQLIARAFSYDFLSEHPDLPPIHSYNIVNAFGRLFVIDLDLDPFVKTNSGVVLVPFPTDIPFYSNGYIYHKRIVTKLNVIEYFSFSYLTEDNKTYKYLEGNTADYMTIAPYHSLTDSNFCPICFPGGATLYHAYSASYADSTFTKRISIPVVLVVPATPDTKKPYYHLRIANVRHIYISKITSETDPASFVIEIQVTQQTHGRVVLLLSHDGKLMSNDFVRFIASEFPMTPAIKAVIDDQSDPVFILPQL